MAKITRIEIEPGKTERTEHDDPWALGQWYWITARDGRWFGCITEIGSNYLRVKSPKIENWGYHDQRIHFDDYYTLMQREENPEKVIADKIAHYKEKAALLMGHVREVTERLGVVPTTGIENKTEQANNALAVISSQVDTTAYKKALIEAKDKTLPELFKEIEQAHKFLAGWMAAPTLPMLATLGPAKESIKTIEDRIETLGLYAGLTEEAVKVRDGDPAARPEKLRVLQRRLYMDEECLLSYNGGGIEYRDIKQFDEWLALPENFERLLPYPRCLVGFRVRRYEKDREDGEGLWRAYVNVQLKEADKTTFLYVRNGDQLWRIDANFDFGPTIFPDVTEFDPSQPQMIKMFAGRVDAIIPRSAWEVMKAAADEQKRLHDEWNEAHPEVKNRWFENPHRIDSFHRLDDYEPFDPSSVYFDDASNQIAEQIKRYNRTAVIIQGLFDRSLALHPHDRVQVWNHASFSAAIELIFDATTLTHGDAPDFEEYRRKLNETLGPDSIVTGQDDYWATVEAERENRRIENDYRNRDRRANYRRFRPYDNPGPGFVGPMTEWKPRSRKAVFRWEMEKQDWRSYNRGMKPKVVEVPATHLLNVSAYKPGDFRQFFSDVRTRRDYLKWAPLMLAAEDYHAGKLKPRGQGDVYDFR